MNSTTIDIKAVLLAVLAALAIAAAIVLAAWPAYQAYAHDLQAASVVSAEATGGSQTIYRLYNRWSGEHLYTNDKSEYDKLASIGWKGEGEAWDSPTSGTPVYRLYNSYSGDHHYTTDASEYNYLGTIGWKKENVAWYSDGSSGTALYRLFNPYEKVGTHHYTSSASERDTMVKNGWRAEGVAWYGHKWANHYATRIVPVYEKVGTAICNGCGKKFYSDHAYHGTPEERYDQSWTAGYKAGNHLLECTNPNGCAVVSYGTGSEVIQTGTKTESYVDYKYCTCCNARK